MVIVTNLFWCRRALVVEFSGHEIVMLNHPLFFRLSFFLGLLILGTPCLHGDDVEWMTNATEATEKAKKENKDILFLFTGSDWCPPCKKLEAEVFEAEGFDEVTSEYILVKFDFPKQKALPAGLKKQNDAWAEKFGVSGYPTVVLTDQKVLPFAIVGYEAGGVENYLGMLEEMRQKRVHRDEKFSAAKTAKADEKAKLLDAGLSKLDPKIVEVYYSDVVETIVELDKDNKLGLRAKWNASEDAEIRKLILSDILMISRLEKPERAIEFIDEVVKEIEFPAEQMLEILQIKLPLVRSLNDNQKLDRLLDEMIALDGVAGDTQERLIVKKVFLMVGTGRKEQAMKLLDRSISGGGSNLYLYLAKAELLALENKFTDAIEALDTAIRGAGGAPDVMIELVTAKADFQVENKDDQGALQTLDNFSDDQQMPADLRAEALLHKSLILRQRGRSRLARLAENRAIEMGASDRSKAATQKLVERLRKKFDR